MLAPEIIGLIGIFFLLFLILAGIPIAIASSVVGFIGCWVLMGLTPALGVLYTVPIEEVASYALSVIPLFILMGVFALHGGIGEELYDAGVKWFGRLPGGLAMATTVANGLFGACSGSSLAAAATFTKLSLPEMRRYNYHNRLSTGVIAASGCMAAMIPPSGMMVIFCTFSDVSLGKFLIAGIIPGVLSVILYMISIYVRTKLSPGLAPPVSKETSWLDKILSLRFLFAAFLTFAVLLGGIYFGLFSPTEGGAAGAFVIFLIVLFRKRFNKQNLINSFTETVSTSAMIFFIIIGAMIFSQFLSVSRLPAYFIDLITGSAIPSSLTVILVLLMYILLGTFLDAVAMMALTLPIVYPLIESLGVNGLWFGIMVILMTEIALITPPLGLNVYVVKGIAPDDIKLEDIFVGIMPFLLMNLLLLALIFIFPSIVTWLPSGMH